MEILTTNKVEQTELVDQIDFVPEIKNWLLEKGYTRRESNYVSKKVSYVKGLLEIEPSTIFVKGGIDIFIHTNTHLSSDLKSIEFGKEKLVEKDIECKFIDIENELNQAQDDLKEFCNYLRYGNSEGE